MYKTLNIIFLTIVILVLVEGLHGQNILQPSPIDLVELGVKQGLSQGMINCIYQDSEGYIWIATKDGLNRYDGYNIYTFRHSANDRFSLPDNYCNSITEDDLGNIWVGTNTKGLFLFDKKTERFYNVPEINVNDQNLCVRELHQASGKLFINTYKNVVILNIEKLAFNKDLTDVSNAKIAFDYSKTIYCEKDGSNQSDAQNPTWSWISGKVHWLSLHDSIYRFELSDDNSKWRSQSFAPSVFGINENLPTKFYFFAKNNAPDQLIIAHNNLISCYDSATKAVVYTDTLPEIPIKYVKLKNGNIFGLTPSKVLIYNIEHRETEMLSAGYPTNKYCSIITLLIDANGMQWLGSNGCGIIIRDPQKKRFRSYKGMHTKDVYSKMPSSLIPTISPTIDKLHIIYRIILDRNNRYWILAMSNDGPYKSNLYSHDLKTGKVTKYERFISGHVGFIIYMDPKDNLWYCYQDYTKKNYLARIDKMTGALSSRYEIPECIESTEPYVSQCYADNDGKIWLATVNGLYAFDEKKSKWSHWRNIPNIMKSISADGVLSICPDPASPDTYLWLGTEGAGIDRFEKSTGHCVNYNESQGLSNNVAYCILSDSDGNLWISTNRGLSCFDPTHKTFRNFSDDDGLPGNEFNRYSAMKMLNGDLMFGGVNGFVIFDPKAVLAKQSSAPIVFTSVSLFNKTISWPANSKNLSAQIGYTDALILQPGENIFSISFATLEYRSNQKKLYKYKLEGFDKDWSNPSIKNEVSYTNLNPGRYTFYVKGANTDGVWSDDAISLDIVVKPHWYQTLLFKIFTFGLIAFLLYAFYRYRLMQGLKIEKLRNRIARDLHDEIGSTLSSISIYAAAAKKVTPGNEKANNILSKISTGTTEMMEAMNDIIWAVNTGSGHFFDLVNRARSFAVKVTEAKNIGLHFTENDGLINVKLNMEQRKNIYLICKEAISNAVKYSECSLLEVEISCDNQSLHIDVKDNGRGFEFENPEHSFGGNGIKNMRFRASEINATIDVQSHIGVGTHIALIVPLKYH